MFVARLFIIFYFIFSPLYAQKVFLSKDYPTTSYSHIINKAFLSIVNIYAVSVDIGSFSSPLLKDKFFKYFFGEPSFTGFGFSRERNSLGSGVVVSSNGFIVTNYHIVKNVKKLRVSFLDNREFDANVILVDKLADVAILKINADNLPYLKLRNADELEVGDIVLSLANPFGFGKRAIGGIISSVPENRIVGDYRFYIKIDRRINPGNSGGAIITLDGGLIGIGTYLSVAKDVGFVIPSNFISKLLSRVDSKTADVVRPWIGVLVRDLDLVEEENEEGVFIKAVYDDSPAYKAGLREGDIIVAINGRKILNKSSYYFASFSYPVGSKINFSILRKSEMFDIEVSVGGIEAPKTKSHELTGRHPLSGAKVVKLTPYYSNELGLSFLETGILILSTRKSSLAYKMGFLRGDVIKKINGRDTDNMEDLIKILSRKIGRWAIEFKRDKRLHKIIIGK